MSDLYADVTRHTIYDIRQTTYDLHILVKVWQFYGLFCRFAVNNNNNSNNNDDDELKANPNQVNTCNTLFEKVARAECEID